MTLIIILIVYGAQKYLYLNHACLLSPSQECVLLYFVFQHLLVFMSLSDHNNLCLFFSIFEGQ